MTRFNVSAKATALRWNRSMMVFDGCNRTSSLTLL